MILIFFCRPPPFTAAALVAVLVRIVLNSHEHTSRPVGVNPFLLFRCGQVPIPDPLAELAGGKILELRHVQHATGQLHIPIPFSAV